MDLSSLKPAPGSVKKSKRIGRGQGSGKGGTATKGTKGQQSRTGYSKKIGFEGGQMPLQRRLPKFGFRNPNRVEYTGFNLDKLQEIAEKYKTDTIDFDFLYSNRFIKKNEVYKILGRGELKSKVNVKAHAFSEAAKAAIEQLGGAAETI